jgi:hypothetical protein
MWNTWERGEKFTRFWWESPKEGDHLEDGGINGRIGLEWIFGRLAGGGLWSGFTWLRIGTGSCECGDELMGSGTTELVS